jgi:hypothetical protein
MHDLLAVHFLEATQDRVDGCLDLQRLEFVLGFDLIVELSSFKQLHYNVKGVFGLEYLKETHAVAVAECSHDFYLLN